MPVILSLVLLGAHFLRDSAWVGVFACLLLLTLLFVRRPWAARVIQVALVLGALEWAHTLYELVTIRMAHGQPVMRMLFILGIVETITLFSALSFETAALKRIYRRQPRV